MQRYIIYKLILLVTYTYKKKNKTFQRQNITVYTVTQQHHKDVISAKEIIFYLPVGTKYIRPWCLITTYLYFRYAEVRLNRYYELKDNTLKEFR